MWEAKVFHRKPVRLLSTHFKESEQNNEIPYTVLLCRCTLISFMYYFIETLKSYSRLYCSLHHVLSFWIPSTGLRSSPVTVKTRTLWSCTMLGRKMKHPVGNPKCAEWPFCPQKLTSHASHCRWKTLWVVRRDQSFIVVYLDVKSLSILGNNSDYFQTLALIAGFISGRVVKELCLK